MFGKVSERRESQYWAVLMKYCRKVKGEQVITPQVVKQLNTENIDVVPGKLFCRQTHCIDDQDKFHSVKDTENEFTECQTPWKKHLSAYTHS